MQNKRNTVELGLNLLDVYKRRYLTQNIERHRKFDL